MALDFDGWRQPVSEEAPCGPDLNVSGDTDYLLFRAQVEGQLPRSYFSFDPKSLDIKADVAGALQLLERSRDLEIMVLVERLLALDQDLDGFVAALEAITGVLETRWDDVHPQAIDGDFAMRAVPLTLLDDRPTVVLPLQHLPLLQVERIGRLSYRDHLLGAGELSPRDGEVVDPDRIRKILQTAELDEMVRVRDTLHRGVAQLERIRAIFVEQAGYEQAVKLTTLPSLLSGMGGLLDAAIKERDPSLAGGGLPDADDVAAVGDTQAAPVRAQGTVASHDDARRALAAASRYFVRSEPASASRLLIHQARQLMGLSFAEMLATLAPGVASDAAISIPGRRPIRLELERLGDRLSSEADAIARDCGDDEPGSSEAIGSGDDDEAAGEAATEASSPTASSESAKPAQEPSIFRADTRAEAVALLDAVSAWYRVNEPASPIPMLLDKARDLANRDFAALLQDMIEE